VPFKSFEMRSKHMKVLCAYGMFSARPQVSFSFSHLAYVSISSFTLDTHVQ
jgi:hypothetical protein